MSNHVVRLVCSSMMHHNKIGDKRIVTTDELNTIHRAIRILRDSDYPEESKALQDVLDVEAPQGWWGDKS